MVAAARKPLLPLCKADRYDGGMNLLEMNPLWMEHPEIPWGSAGWRMGPGESYWVQWMDAYKTAAPADVEQYKARFQEPDEWQGFYEYLATKKVPLKFKRLFDEIDRGENSQN